MKKTNKVILTLLTLILSFTCLSDNMNDKAQKFNNKLTTINDFNIKVTNKEFALKVRLYRNPIRSNCCIFTGKTYGSKKKYDGWLIVKDDFKGKIEDAVVYGAIYVDNMSLRQKDFQKFLDKLSDSEDFIDCLVMLKNPMFDYYKYKDVILGTESGGYDIDSWLLKDWMQIRDESETQQKSRVGKRVAK